MMASCSCILVATGLKYKVVTMSSALALTNWGTIQTQHALSGELYPICITPT